MLAEGHKELPKTMLRRLRNKGMLPAVPPSICSLGMFRSLYEFASVELLLLLLPPLFLKYVFIVISFFLHAAKFEYHRIMVSNLGAACPRRSEAALHSQACR